VTDFVESYRFSHFHKFTFDEWRDIIVRQNLTILFTNGHIDGAVQNVIAALSEQFCGVSLFGWAPIGHSFKILARLIRGDQSRPFVATVTTDGCHYLYRETVTEGSIRQFLSEIANGEGDCIRGLAETRAQFTPTPEEPPEVNFTPWIIGLIFVAIAIVLVLTTGRSRFRPRTPGTVRAFKFK
jgi:hypothetical protein